MAQVPAKKKKPLKQRMMQTQVWKSVFRHDFQDTPRTRMLRIVGNVFLHLHPARMRKDALNVNYSWGLGVLSTFLFFILTVSGIILMFYYRPTVGLAYRDIKDLEFVVTMGLFWRNLHRWSAHAMVVAVILHMVRVFLTGAHKPPREFNWCIGVVLLTLTLFLSYTGYLLPWDQLALWAVTVGANMAAASPIIGAEGPFSLVGPMADMRFMLIGGTTVGEATLIRFYVLHCMFVPFIFSGFLMVHLWRVRKDAFSKQTGPKVDTWPHLVRLEFLACLGTLVALFLWALLVNAPLEGVANPAITPNPSKAPWYFVGLQELLVYFDPWIAGVMFPNLIIVGLMVIPYVEPNTKGIGTYAFKERPLSICIFMFGIIMWFGLIFIGAYCRGPNWEWYWPWETWSHRRLMSQTLLNLPNYCGVLLLGAYFAEGLPISHKFGEQVKQQWGDKVPPWKVLNNFAPISDGFHVCMGLVMSAAVMVPLVMIPALYQGLGTSQNAPIQQAIYGQAGMGPMRIVWMSVLVLIGAALFTWTGRKFAHLKGDLWKQLGAMKYMIVMSLLLMMFGVMGKIALRLLFGVKYVLSFPVYNFNI